MSLGVGLLVCDIWPSVEKDKGMSACGDDGISGKWFQGSSSFSLHPTTQNGFLENTQKAQVSLVLGNR